MACSSTAPAEAGVYRLRRRRDTTLPYVDTLGCCTYRALLRLDGEDYEARIFFLNPPNTTTLEAFELGRYHRRGDSLDFVPASGNFPLSLYRAHLQADTIRLSLGGDGPGAADQYPAVFWR